MRETFRRKAAASSLKIYRPRDFYNHRLKCILKRFDSLLSVVAGLTVIGGLPSPALEAPLYSQAGNGSACVPDCWTSTFALRSSGYRTYGNFQFNQAANINQVTWQGFYYDHATTANNPVSPKTVSWTIEFFADTSGLPGAQLYTITLLAARCSL